MITDVVINHATFNTILLKNERYNGFETKVGISLLNDQIHM